MELGLKDVIDICFSAQDRIDLYWNFYVVGVLAIIGWLISLKRRLNWQFKVFVSFVTPRISLAVSSKLRPRSRSAVTAFSKSSGVKKDSSVNVLSLKLKGLYTLLNNN